MSMKAVVSEKGQVTIPKRLRDRLGIVPGAVLEFREESGTLVASKASSAVAIASVNGNPVLGRALGELVDELRGVEGG